MLIGDDSSVWFMVAAASWIMVVIGRTKQLTVVGDKSAATTSPDKGFDRGALRDSRV